MELEATHITTTQGGEDERLVCELYPGVLVTDGVGLHTARTFAGCVEALPAGQDRTFPISERLADQAAELFEKQVRSATISGDPWPPRGWPSH